MDIEFDKDFQIEILTCACKNLLKELEYSDKYIHILQSYMPEEYFEIAKEKIYNMAKDYCRKPFDLSKKEIVNRALCLIHTLKDMELDSSQIATMLNLICPDVEFSLQEFVRRKQI